LVVSEVAFVVIQQVTDWSGGDDLKLIDRFRRKPLQPFPPEGE